MPTNPHPPLTLVLVRHGEAGTAGSDDARELTTEGRRAVRMLSADLQSRTLSPVVIRTSPARRAHQTAETIFSALPDPGPVRPTNQLASGARLKDLLQLLRAERPGSSVVWVGHMPDLGRLAAFLLGQPGEVAFKAGAALALAVDLGGVLPVGRQQWAWNP
jgi:phosphohistidine phosphatase